MPQALPLTDHRDDPVMTQAETSSLTPLPRRQKLFYCLGVGWRADQGETENSYVIEIELFLNIEFGGAQRTWQGLTETDTF